MSKRFANSTYGLPVAFFALVNAWVARRMHRPMLLLAAIVGVSGVFSAFLVNDAICLVMAPLVIEMTVGLKRNPVPYLLAVAMASNVGSTATITGNPQNMLIGSFSGISYIQFVATLAPVAAVGLLLTIALLALLHRGDLRGGVVEAHPPRVRVNQALVVRSLLATAVVVVLLLRRRGDWISHAGWATVALIASLAWVMPWYVIWVLPLAALGSSIWLRRAALVMTVFLVLVFLPSSGKFWNLINFNPLSGSAGQASQTLQSKLSWYR